MLVAGPGQLDTVLTEHLGGVRAHVGQAAGAGEVDVAVDHGDLLNEAGHVVALGRGRGDQGGGDPQHVTHDLDHGGVDLVQAPALGGLNALAQLAPAGLKVARGRVPPPDDVGEVALPALADHHVLDRDEGGLALQDVGGPAPAHGHPALVAVLLELVVHGQDEDVAVDHLVPEAGVGQEVWLVDGDGGHRRISLTRAYCSA